MRLIPSTLKLVHTLAPIVLSVACQSTTPPAACPEPPPESGQPASSPQRLPESPENHERAVRQLLELMDMRQVMNASLDATLAAQLEANPSLNPFADAMREFLGKYLSWESLENEFVQIYLEAFSQREVEDLTAFYGTPTGRKSVELLPQLMAKGAALGQRRVAAHQNELQEMLNARIQELQQPSQ